jgi:hypothetical protein
MRDADKVLTLKTWQQMARSEDELTQNVGRYWAGRLESGLPLAQSSPMAVGVLRLGAGHTIIWISAEAVAEWLPIIRECSHEMDIFVWGYSQFVPTYLPTDALLAEEGYEVVNANRYEVNGPGPFAKGLDKSFTGLIRNLLATL